DGLSAPMVLLTGILGPLTVLFAWEEQKRPALFFGLLLLLQTATLGVFVTLDYFVFYLFWEVVLIPMFFLIAIWGGPARRYAAYKFFIYTFTASLVMLVGFMALYFEAGVNTFSMIEIAKQSGNFAPAFQKWVFAAHFIGFAVKMPMVPFHTWLPDAHVEAPTAGSIVLAGVMLKLGLYGLMRAALAPLPFGAEYFVPVMVTLAIVSIIYGAALSLAQTDLKKLVAYSSISHMGIALLGVATLTELGLAGAVYMMFAHGLLSPAMFMIAGVVLHQLGTRDIPKLGGLAQKQPYTATLFVVIFLGSLGLPGMATFVAELSVFVAFFQSHGYWLLLPISGMVLTAGYHLWALQRSVFGPLSKKVDIEKVHEAPWYEQWPLFAIVTLAVLFGVLPQLLMSPVTVACYDILRLMGGV
nr:NADH-quinone oxidoreductase subunit M [Pseudomonadales bacterium]